LPTKLEPQADPASIAFPAHNYILHSTELDEYCSAVANEGEKLSGFQALSEGGSGCRVGSERPFGFRIGLLGIGLPGPDFRARDYYTCKRIFLPLTVREKLIGISIPKSLSS
jgi:hypothetical protein